jgi:hypothetical protein
MTSQVDGPTPTRTVSEAASLAQSDYAESSQVFKNRCVSTGFSLEYSHTLEPVHQQSDWSTVEKM